MKPIKMMMALGLTASLVGCGDDTGSNNNPDLAMTIAPDMAMMAGFPAAPTIGSTQIDRMGRAGVNTALTDPFNLDSMHDQTQDAYNAAAPATWSTFIPKIEANLAILDGLDGVCGNQPPHVAAAADQDGGAPNYSFLAGALADDQLYVDTTVALSSDPTKNYLAVEVAAITSVVTGTATPAASCGGRTPLDDVINITYQTLAGSATMVGDGVAADGDPTANSANTTTFPFLGTPQ
jgi:hypothetical protein